MKKRINIILGIIILILAAILVYMLIMRQGNSSEPIDNTAPIETSTPEPTAEQTEAPHEHVYTETITIEATCETNGLKTFTCECGDTYTEDIIAMGHVFGEYIYNGDATYFEDGTQTAQCKKCEATDTGTARGSKLEYTFTYIEKTMYAQQIVNVRNMPCTDGEKIGSLSTNDEVWVVRQCNETGWYEINNTDISGYVSDSYLGPNKVAVNNSSNSSTPSTGGGTLTITDSSGTHVYTEEEAIAMGYIPSPGGGYTLPFSPDPGDGGELIDNPNFVIGDGSGNYYDQYGNLVNP